MIVDKRRTGEHQQDHQKSNQLMLPHSLQHVVDTFENGAKYGFDKESQGCLTRSSSSQRIANNLLLFLLRSFRCFLTCCSPPTYHNLSSSLFSPCSTPYPSF